MNNLSVHLCNSQKSFLLFFVENQFFCLYLFLTFIIFTIRIKIMYAYHMVSMNAIYFVLAAIVEQGLLRFYDAIIQGVLRHFNFEGMCTCTCIR